MGQKSIDISVVTPFYCGNQYLERLFCCVRRNAEYNRAIKVEWILVNDSPGYEIAYKQDWVHHFQLRIINNPENRGIQASRICGIRAASGEYIVMLDQDDLLREDALYLQWKRIKGYDIIVANGIDENKLSYGTVYRSGRQQRLVMDKRYYYAIGNMIVSPGQCLIRKSKIPALWCSNIIAHNGSDDLFLWLLMLGNGSRWTINPDRIYTHVDTGSNVSADLEKMTESSMEVLQYLKAFGMVSPADEKRFVRRFRMRRRYEGRTHWRKIAAYICYPDIALYLLTMRLSGGLR